MNCRRSRIRFRFDQLAITGQVTHSPGRIGYASGKLPYTRQVVAVGTTITDRPPHRSVRARLRIRLLRRMRGVEACVGIRMQDARLWNPSVQQWGKSLPPPLCSLTAPDENTPPQPVDTSLKDAELSRVARHTVVLVIPQHNSPTPCTHRA